MSQIFWKGMLDSQLSSIQPGMAFYLIRIFGSDDLKNYKVSTFSIFSIFFHYKENKGVSKTSFFPANYPVFIRIVDRFDQS
jgi:hypothetical protein